MESPIDQQLHQVHTTYVSMIPNMLGYLVQSGALSTEAAQAIVREARVLLDQGPARGDAVQTAKTALRQLEERLPLVQPN